MSYYVSFYVLIHRTDFNLLCGHLTVLLKHREQLCNIWGCHIWWPDWDVTLSAVSASKYFRSLKTSGNTPHHIPKDFNFLLQWPFELAVWLSAFHCLTDQQIKKHKDEQQPNMDQCTSQGSHLTFWHNRLRFYFYKWYVKYSQSVRS